MSSLASELHNGDSFMTSFPQGGVLRHKQAHLELTFTALAQGQRSLLASLSLAKTLFSSYHMFSWFRVF